MSTSAQRADNPFMRPSNAFERRAAWAISQAKPNLSSNNILCRTLPGGTALETTRRIGRASAVETPWSLRITGSIVPGTIGGIIPKIGDTPISGTSTIPTLDIPDTGLLVAELKFAVTWNSDFLSDPITLSYVKFTIESELPLDEVASGRFFRVFGFITGGLPGTRLYTNGNLHWTLCGNAVNSATLILA